MSNPTLPPELKAILQERSHPEQLFAALLPMLGEILQCDRCFLYVRHPETRIGKTVECWRRHPRYPDTTSDWQQEPAQLAQEDPLFAAALRTEPSIFVEDVETADPQVVNRQFEHQHFGHRALIHAHLCWDDQLWGILQPAVFAHPRIWTASDRTLITQLEPLLAQRAKDYVQAEFKSQLPKAKVQNSESQRAGKA